LIIDCVVNYLTLTIIDVDVMTIVIGGIIGDPV